MSETSSKNKLLLLIFDYNYNESSTADVIAYTN